MRTESQPSAVHRFRAEVARARHWVGGRGRWARLSALFAMIACVGGGIYLLTLPSVEQPAWLYESRKLSEDQGQAIQSALAAEDIQVFTDRHGRIGVRPSSYTKALTALRKRKVEPPSFEEIVKETQTPNLWETGEQREQRLHWGMEKQVKLMIEGLPDIRSAQVTVQRERVRGGVRTEWKFTGFVWVDVDGGHELSPRTVRSIQALLVANCNGLKPDSVSVSDQSGKFYLEAGNPVGGVLSRTLARADELRETILERLNYIKGVDVLVQMEAVAPEPPPHPAPTVAPSAAKDSSAAEILPNQPIELGPEPAPTPAPAAAPRPALPAVPRAKVWVQVPRSYYYNAFADNVPGKQPSPEDLTPYISRTSELIRNAVSVIVPSHELGDVKIDTIPDSINFARVTASPLPSSDGWGDRLPAWGPGAIVGVLVGLTIAIATSFGLMATRRPKSEPAPRGSTRRGGIAVDQGGEAVHGPSERVRELVRANPEAAAGVLHRWIGREDGGNHG